MPGGKFVAFYAAQTSESAPETLMPLILDLEKEYRAAKADPANAEAIRRLGEAEGTLGSVLGRLFALSEAYPDLKADRNMMHFQEELASTENKVAFARQAFNDAVMTYNNAVQNVPNNIIAGMFNFEESTFLDIDSPAKREVPEVAFT